MKNLLHEITTTIGKIRSSLHGMTSKCQQLWITMGSLNRRCLAAEHPNCPIKILEILSDDYWPVRFRVTQNPNCPIKLLEKLADDEDSYVRECVALNPNCPTRLLEKLTDDECYWVREYVAGNRNCPVKILEKLADDERKSVRSHVAQNPNCPEYIKKFIDARDYMEKSYEQV